MIDSSVSRRFPRFHLKIRAGLTQFTTYSPELQPCERLWPLSNEAIANCHFKTLDELQEVQAQHCITLQNDRIGIRHITLFHWWPTAFSYLKEGDLTVPQV